MDSHCETKSTHMQLRLGKALKKRVTKKHEAIISPTTAPSESCAQVACLERSISATDRKSSAMRSGFTA